MFEKMQLKEHMEITDANGQHVGTVDHVEDNRIKLTKSDSEDAKHHYVQIDSVDRVEDNRAYLKADAVIPEGLGS